MGSSASASRLKPDSSNDSDNSSREKSDTTEKHFSDSNSAANQSESARYEDRNKLLNKDKPITDSVVRPKEPHNLSVPNISDTDRSHSDSQLRRPRRNLPGEEPGSSRSFVNDESSERRRNTRKDINTSKHNLELLDAEVDQLFADYPPPNRGNRSKGSVAHNDDDDDVFSNELTDSVHIDDLHENPQIWWKMWGKDPRMSMSFTQSKGLLNAPGANNCFLNSAVQVSLGHSEGFC